MKEQQNKNQIDWIKSKLIKFNYDKNEVLKLYKDFKSETNSTGSLDCYRKRISEAYKEILVENPNEENLIEYTAKINASKQKLTDKNNIITKEIREQNRLHNLLEDQNDELIKLLKTIDLNKFKLIEHKIKKEKQKFGIIVLSDIHAGQLVEAELNIGNEYNFNILSNRLKYFISRCIIELINNKVTDVLLCNLGDNITSNRRLSELTSLNSSLSKATLLLTYILKQVIIELQKYFNVSICFCVGNESRSYNDNMSSANLLVSENYDFTIHNMLRIMFEKSSINFIESNNREDVITYGNKNFMILHGDILKDKKIVEDKIRDLISRYNTIFKKSVDYTLLGHFHSTNINSYYSISGSCMGSDNFSGRDCLYLNRASQIFGIIENDSIEFKNIDLQNIYYNIKGYDIIKELEYYGINNYQKQ